jgi:hypothetical protein
VARNRGRPSDPTTPWFVRCARCAVGRTVRILPAVGRAYDAGQDYYLCPRCTEKFRLRRKREEWDKSLFGDWHEQNQTAGE